MNNFYQKKILSSTFNNIILNSTQPNRFPSFYLNNSKNIINDRIPNSTEPERFDFENIIIDDNFKYSS